LNRVIVEELTAIVKAARRGVDLGRLIRRMLVLRTRDRVAKVGSRPRMRMLVHRELGMVRFSYGCGMRRRLEVTHRGAIFEAVDRIGSKRRSLVALLLPRSRDGRVREGSTHFIDAGWRSHAFSIRPRTHLLLLLLTCVKFEAGDSLRRGRRDGIRPNGQLLHYGCSGHRKSRGLNEAAGQLAD
jgi:hypothetical protein